MNSNFQTIPESEIQFFKEKVKHWLNVDEQIDELQKQIKELKKVRDKELSYILLTNILSCYFCKERSIFSFKI